MQVVRAGAPALVSANNKVLKRVSCIRGAVWVETPDGRLDVAEGEDVLIDRDSQVFSLSHAHVNISEVDGLELRLQRLEAGS